MSECFDDVQRIVLCGTRWQAARHLMLDFGAVSPLHFLNALLTDANGSHTPTAASVKGPGLQFSLGFTRLGLKRADVPDHVLACFALKSPAYWAGAQLRAAGHLRLTGESAAQRWDDKFTHTKLHAVLSVHARQERELDEVVADLRTLAASKGLGCTLLPAAAALPAPSGVAARSDEQPPGQWVHFGYRDGLARIGIHGWSSQKSLAACQPMSQHQAGEFVLGHVPDCGADPWIAGPGLRIWPDKVRGFFHNGSFGVLQQIEQDVAAFEDYVKRRATDLKDVLPGDLTSEQDRIREIKGKLCGRYPDGQPLAVANDRPNPAADFDYRDDPHGVGCPFGGHVRRMNPRVPRLDAEHSADMPGPATRLSAPNEDELGQFPAHFSRPRPLLRRGMPYGGAWAGQPDKVSRGLIGQFFCASIENQFEHLLGEWADRVPLGSPDEGGARDPFIGAHEPGDGPFAIARKGSPALLLRGLAPFTRTLGASYLFYPSLTTLRGIADSCLWRPDNQDDER